jgi:hypothetical protein
VSNSFENSNTLRLVRTAVLNVLSAASCLDY